MPTLRFSDGMEINTDGAYRVIRKSDGLYVVGKGFLCAVDSREEGKKMIAEMEFAEGTASVGGSNG